MAKRGPIAATHYVDYDEPGMRLARAVCGTYVHPKKEHSNTPTCPVCQAVLTQRSTETVDNMFGGEDHGK